MGPEFKRRCSLRLCRGNADPRRLTARRICERTQVGHSVLSAAGGCPLCFSRSDGLAFERCRHGDATCAARYLSTAPSVALISEHYPGDAVLRKRTGG